MANKIFLIGDFHLSLGFPNKVDKWFKVSQEYCETFLFPLMEKTLDKDDILTISIDSDEKNILKLDVENEKKKLINLSRLKIIQIFSVEIFLQL